MFSCIPASEVAHVAPNILGCPFFDKKGNCDGQNDVKILLETDEKAFGTLTMNLTQGLTPSALKYPFHDFALAAFLMQNPCIGVSKKATYLLYRK